MLASHYYEGKIEAGCDEAGRGCLAGSVFAAAVILPKPINLVRKKTIKRWREKELFYNKSFFSRLNCGLNSNLNPSNINRTNY